MNKQVYIDLIINGTEYELPKQDILYFKISTSAGAVQPFFSLVFRGHDEKLKDAIVPNSTIQIFFGVDKENSDQFDVALTDVKVDTDATNDSYVVTLSGARKTLAFYLDKKSECYVGTSLQVMKEFLAEYLSDNTPLETDITEVNETASIWNRTNESPTDFLFDIWTHMNIMPSFPLFAIDMYGVPMLKSFDNVIKQEPKWTFTNGNTAGTNKIKYLKNFKAKSYKSAYNIYSGYGKLVNTYNISTGLEDVSILKSEVLMAQSQEPMTSNGGFKILDGYMSGGNTHKDYCKAYFYNTDKLVNMSTIQGKITLLGDTYRQLRPLDLVYVEIANSPNSRDCGKYLIDCILVEYSYSVGIVTTVSVCRDNYNNIENNIPIPKSIDKIMTANLVKDLTSVCRNLRTYIAFSRGLVDGTVLDRVFTYAKSLKYMALTGFNMNFFGAKINFNSPEECLQTIRNLGNSIINAIIDLYIPAPYNTMLKDIALRASSMTSFKDLLTRLQQFLPADLQVLISEMTALVAESMVTLNYISNKYSSSNTNSNISTRQYENSTVTFTETVNGVENVEVTVESSNITSEQRVNEILDEFSENTSGADIPMPIVVLSDSESFLNDAKLKDYLADEVVAELEARGYLTDIDNFKDILLGNAEMDFQTINKIEQNIGSIMYTRFWGVYNSLVELTDFFITKSYKDTYKTPQTTKIVNAKAGQKVFIAYPALEEIKIYINNELKNLEYVEMDLGYTDSSGNTLIYNVYYTEEGYNSNSVVVEIRKKNS